MVKEGLKADGRIFGTIARVPKPKTTEKEPEDPFVDNKNKDEEEEEDEEDEMSGFPRNEEGLPMPQTLVRIPVNGGSEDEGQQPQQG